MKLLFPAGLLLLVSATRVASQHVPLTLLGDWPTGFKMLIEFPVPQDVRGGWRMSLKFSKPVQQNLQTPNAVVRSVSKDGQVFCLGNRKYNKRIPKGQTLRMEVLGNKVRSNEAPPTATVDFHPGRGASCDMTPPATPPLPTGTSAPQEAVNVEHLETWPVGFKYRFSVLLLQDVNGGWKMTVTFSLPVLSLQTPRAIQKSHSADNKVFYLENRPYNAKLEKCELLDMTVIGTKQMNAPTPTVDVEFSRREGSYTGGDPVQCATTTPPTLPPSTPPTPPPLSTVGSSTPPPSTAGPNTPQPPTAGPSTSAPSTAGPSTPQPPTVGASTPPPSTEEPSTSQPPTAGPSTSPPTAGPSTSEASTSGPSTSEPSTTKASTAAPSTAVPSTAEPTTVGPTPPPPPFNYDLVLHDSILFYEAQRSGKLPANNRIPWRRDSALGDKGDNGEDMTGGWYDAGDYVKFGFPMASSVTVLAWGLIEFRDAYQEAGELSNMLDCIKWPLDYFIKAHNQKTELYGQVGDGHKDHSFWGRPEDMTMARPAWKITPSKPGSDLAAETAAAMAAASIAFKQTNPSYAATLLQHAEELYEFADKYRGKYSDAIPNAGSFYRSSHIEDELVWGAAWLYRASNKAEYLTKAEQFYKQFGINGKPWAFSWDDKKAGAQLLLAKITGKDSYKQDIKVFLDAWLPGREVTYTPKGLAWRDTWGPNRYSANSAFLALVAADQGINSKLYRDFARQQIHYMLGDGGRSYVVGFGNNPPQRPHHRSSSCPLAPDPCGWDAQNSPGPNPQVLRGALVGGPGKNDDYVDDRKDYIKNEVATDYNAGFQSAVAGLKQLAIGNE